MISKTDEAPSVLHEDDGPPPEDPEITGETGDHKRPYEDLARSAVLLRAYHGHILSLFRAATLQDGAEVTLSDIATPEQYMTDVVDYFHRVRSFDSAAKFEMLFTFARDSLSALLGDSYFRTRPLDSAIVQNVLDVYEIGVTKLASSRVGQSKGTARLTNNSPVEHSLRLDPDFLAGYPPEVQLHWFRVLSSLQSVLADFLTDIDRNVSDIGIQHEDAPIVERVKLRSLEPHPALNEVFLVWRNSGDLIGVWDDPDAADDDEGWVPVWARTDGGAT